LASKPIVASSNTPIVVSSSTPIVASSTPNIEPFLATPVGRAAAKEADNGTFHMFELDGPGFVTSRGVTLPLTVAASAGQKRIRTVSTTMDTATSSAKKKGKMRKLYVYRDVESDKVIAQQSHGESYSLGWLKQYAPNWHHFVQQNKASVQCYLTTGLIHPYRHNDPNDTESPLDLLLLYSPKPSTVTSTQREQGTQSTLIYC
jgi:hypothetical protein